MLCRPRRNLGAWTRSTTWLSRGAKSAVSLCVMHRSATSARRAATSFSRVGMADSLRSSTDRQSTAGSPVQRVWLVWLGRKAASGERTSGFLNTLLSAQLVIGSRGSASPTFRPSRHASRLSSDPSFRLCNGRLGSGVGSVVPRERDVCVLQGVTDCCRCARIESLREGWLPAGDRRRVVHGDRCRRGLVASGGHQHRELTGISG